MHKRKVVCCIDGFNLYHGIDELQLPHLKWVNLHGLVQSFLRDYEDLVRVHYFSAFATWLRHQYPRHRQYVNALEAHNVNCVMAHFKQKRRECNACGATWMGHEEKETDVRIALQILEDAEDNAFDRAIIISGDSDLVPAVKTVRRRHPSKYILVATPPGRFHSSRDLIACTGGKGISITRGRIQANLLPKEVINTDSKVVATRPTEYDPPGTP